MRGVGLASGVEDGGKIGQECIRAHGGGGGESTGDFQIIRAGALGPLAVHGEAIEQELGSVGDVGAALSIRIGLDEERLLANVAGEPGVAILIGEDHLVARGQGGGGIGRVHGGGIDRPRAQAIFQRERGGRAVDAPAHGGGAKLRLGLGRGPTAAAIGGAHGRAAEEGHARRLDDDAGIGRLKGDEGHYRSGTLRNGEPQRARRSQKEQSKEARVLSYLCFLFGSLPNGISKCSRRDTKKINLRSVRTSRIQPKIFK